MKTLLVIEDEAMTRKLVLRMIQSMGCAVILASNGKKGIEILKENPHIDMVITDMQMPEIDGLAVISEIRSKKSWDHIPILVYSAYIKLKDIGSLLELGANAFLPKPIQKIDLEENIKRYIEQKP